MQTHRHVLDGRRQSLRMLEHFFGNAFTQQAGFDASQAQPTGQMAGPGSGAARPGDLIADPCQAVPRPQVAAPHGASFSQYRPAQSSRTGTNQSALNSVCSDPASAWPTFKTTPAPP